MDRSLVLLAAGLGSRFGGTKQIVPVGPSGETLLDYTIVDAERAGFRRVVLVVRTEIEDAVLDHVRRIHPHLAIVSVLQDRAGPVRAKPWGTAHAVLACADAVPGSFAVANADDYYGTSSFAALGHQLEGDPAPGRYAAVGFELGQTLSDQGAVTRGVLEVDDDGSLVRISEERGVHRDEQGVIRTASDPKAALDPATPVSMNLWGFGADLFARLDDGFHAFHAEHADDPDAEYLLPDAVGDLVTAGTARVRVLRSDVAWFGITHADDLSAVQARVRALVDAGDYPPDLAAR